MVLFEMARVSGLPSRHQRAGQSRVETQWWSRFKYRLVNEQWLSINFWRKIFLILLLDGILFDPYHVEIAHSAVDIRSPFEEQLLNYVEGRLSARIKLEKL